MSESYPAGFGYFKKVAVDPLEKAIKNNLYEAGIPITWQQGNIKSDTGAASPSDTRLRTIGYFSASWTNGVTIDIPDGFKLCLYGYTDGNIASYIGQISDGWVTGTLSLSFLPYNCNFIRAVLAYSDNSDITPEDAPTVIIKEYVESGLQKRYIAPAFRTGKIKDDGTASPDTTRIRTTRYLKFGNKVNVFVPSGYKIKVFKYTDCVSTALVEYSDFITSTFMLDTDTSLYYRFMIGASDDSTISASAADGFKFEDFNRSQIFIESTNDDTDRTNEINAYLDTYNRVKLGAGKFYTTGITLPDDSTIEGSGYSSILFLTGTSAANAITLGSRCAVRNMQIVGRETDYVLESDDPNDEIVPSTPEDRHGIYFGGDVGKGIIENCYIHGFSGGAITAYNTGYSSQNGLHIKSCDLLLNSVGVYLKYLTEFHLVENCNIVTNYYGIINNGGNNTIVGCNISSTYYAFYFNNSEGTYNNNMHGLMANCEMKHIRTKSIYINNTISSFLFTGCQFGSGGIELINANYMNFGDCVSSDEFSIDVTGGGTTIFNGFIMRSTSNVNITNNDKVKFVNCFDSSGRPFRTPYAIEPIATNAYPTDTAIGSIASFPDGADNIPVKDLTVNIEPVQDLHGQEYPYPAGGGVNKANLAGATPYTDGTYGMYVTVNVNAETITIAGTWSIDNQSGTWRFLNVPNIPNGLSLKAFEQTSGNHVNSSNLVWDGTNQRLIITCSNMVKDTAYTIKIKIVAYEGSTEPTSWSPYSNICPITGWTGCEVTRTGKNLLNISGTQVHRPNVGGTTTIQNESITLKSSTTEAYYTGFIVPVKVGNIYTLSYTSSDSTKVRIDQLDEIITAINSEYGTEYLSGTSITANKPYFLVNFTAGNAERIFYNPQLELGSTATDYEPYHGEQISITFPSDAGTVYGCTLDVTTGVLTVDRASATFDGSDSTGWSRPAVYGSSTRFDKSISGLKSGSGANLRCNYLKNGTIGTSDLECCNVHGSSSVFQMQIATSRLSEDTITGLMTYFSSNPLSIVYELATPVTYQLTPIEVKTLLGYNNIWADTGNSTVEYRANTKLYIDKKIATAVAALA